MYVFICVPHSLMFEYDKRKACETFSMISVEFMWYAWAGISLSRLAPGKSEFDRKQNMFCYAAFFAHSGLKTNVMDYCVFGSGTSMLLSVTN